MAYSSFSNGERLQSLDFRTKHRPTPWYPQKEATIEA